jgi:hypothetical protein
MVGNIIELAKKHNSQKATLTYMLDGYQKHLPKTCNNFLEIGVLRLGSTKMFRDFYNGNAQIHALDLYHPRFTSGEEEAKNEGFITYKGSQLDLELLSTLPDLDVISEDGSHHSDAQIITFKYLFENKLNKGGLYILEDVHCCYNPYWWVSVQGFNNTFVGVLNKLRDYGDMVSQFFTQEESDKFVAMIKSVHVYKDHEGNDSIVFIYKK